MNAGELLFMYWLCKYGLCKDEEKAEFWRKEYIAYMKRIQRFPPVFGKVSPNDQA